MFLFQILDSLPPHQGHEFSIETCQGIVNSAFICNGYFLSKIHNLIFSSVCFLAADEESV